MTITDQIRATPAEDGARRACLDMLQTAKRRRDTADDIGTVNEYQRHVAFFEHRLRQLAATERFEPLAPPEPAPPRARPVTFAGFCLAIASAVVIAAIWRV
jgi:hypothetical protein